MLNKKKQKLVFNPDTNTDTVNAFTCLFAIFFFCDRQQYVKNKICSTTLP